MFQLSIVTPEKVAYEVEVKTLVVPGTEGYLGILSNHAPLITALKPGRIEFADADDNVVFIAVSGGFLEVSNNQATILADAVELGDEIDIERAQAAYDRQKARLIEGGSGESEIDMPRARASMERAANRIKVYKQAHEKH